MHTLTSEPMLVQENVSLGISQLDISQYVKYADFGIQPKAKSLVTVLYYLASPFLSSKSN